MTYPSGPAPSPGVVIDWRRIDGRLQDGTHLSGKNGGNGTEAFGHEMLHGFGLDHAHEDGNAADYGDDSDMMANWFTKWSVADTDWGARGPGLNATNMRACGWLDESRVWHAPVGDFHQALSLRPLHRLELPGWLAAELPSANPSLGHPRYVVEYRKMDRWDAGLARSCILVHRHEGASNGEQFGSSFAMHGTKGQIPLLAGDSFRDPATSRSKLVVDSIDDATETANIRLCYSTVADPAPSVRIERRSGWDNCLKGAVAEGSFVSFGFAILNGNCLPAGYKVSWSTIPEVLPSSSTSDSTFAFNAPAPGPIVVTVAVTLADDGHTVVSASLKVQVITKAEAGLQIALCHGAFGAGRFRPIPWYEWDPERIRDAISEYSEAEREAIERRVIEFGRNLQQEVRRLRR